MSSINERLQTIVDKLFDGNKAKFAKSIEIVSRTILVTKDNQSLLLICLKK